MNNAIKSVATYARPTCATASFSLNPHAGAASTIAPEYRTHAKTEGTEGTEGTSPIHAGSGCTPELFSKGTGGTKRRYGQRNGCGRCAGMGKQQYRAEVAVLQFLPVLENTLESAGNLPDSEVFSRPESFGFGRDGLVRKAGRMADSMFSTSRPPVALEKAASGFQSQSGAKAMTTVNTTTTPKTGNTSPLARQQAIENALSMALHFIRHGDTQQDIHAATGRAIRAVSMLKQACAEFAIEGSAA